MTDETQPSDPLASFGEATAKPDAKTTERLQKRLDVFVRQAEARKRRVLRRVALLAVMGIAGVVTGWWLFTMFAS